MSRGRGVRWEAGQNPDGDGVVFSASIDGQVPVGTQGCLVVHPEQVALGERTGELDNVLEARVDEVVYVGGG